MHSISDGPMLRLLMKMGTLIAAALAAAASSTYDSGDASCQVDASRDGMMAEMEEGAPPGGYQPPDPTGSEKAVLTRGCDSAMAQRATAFLPPMIGNPHVFMASTDDDDFISKLESRSWDVVFFAPGACRYDQAKQPIPGGNARTEGWSLTEYRALVREVQGPGVAIVETTKEAEIVPRLRTALGLSEIVPGSARRTPGKTDDDSSAPFRCAVGDMHHGSCYHNSKGRLLPDGKNTSDPADCCSQCRATEGCASWTWWDGQQCAFFKSIGSDSGRCTGVSGMGGAAPPPPPAPPRPPSKPGAKNILFLQCDEMDGRVLDPTHPLSRVTSMPHLEALAKRGVNFVRTYTANPICACSRASTFTGRFSSSIRAFSNVKSLTATIGKPDTPDPICASIIGYSPEWCVEQGRLANVSGTGTINTALAAAGYDVQLFGKMDTGGGAPQLPPGATAGGYHVANHADWRHQAPIRGLYYPGCSMHSWARGANITRPAFVPLEQQGNQWVIDDRPQGGPYPGDWKAISECVKFLESWRPSDGPFILYCSVVDPHPPFWSRSTATPANSTDPEGYPILSPGDPGHAWIDQVNDSALNGSLATIPWLPRDKVHPADWYTSVSDGVGPVWDRPLAQRLTRAYHGQTAETDYMMGLVMDALAANKPAAADAWTLFTSDHGEMHLEHRIVQKMSMYEGSARVPMIVAAPPGTPGARRGVIDTTFVSLLDVFPTFADISKAAAPGNLDGYSLADLVAPGAVEPAAGTNPVVERPDFVVSEFTGEEANTAQFLVRKGQWKLIVYGQLGIYENYHPQLFDVEADPLEVHNLADQNPTVVTELKAALSTRLDYKDIAEDVDEEGRAAVKRWMAHFNNSEPVLRPMLGRAYDGFDDGDWLKFTCWLNKSCAVPP